MMAATTANPVRLNIPGAVHAFAAERGLAPYMAGIVDIIVQRVFADATRMNVEIHEDPDEPGLHTILFEVDLPWSQDQWRAGMKAWRRRTAAICSAAVLTEFSLITFRRPE
jgi:hypothetical protein